MLFSTYKTHICNKHTNTAPDICHFFCTGKIFGEKIYTEKRVNYDKRILQQNSVNRDLLDQANYKDQDYTTTVCKTTHRV